MTKLRLALALLLIPACIAIADDVPAPTTKPATTQPAESDDIQVYFSPHGGCTAAIVAEINAPRTSLDLQAYSFTSTQVSVAVVQAHDRGVRVRAIFDKKELGTQYNGATYLVHHGVEAWTDGQHPIAHNKVMVIDGVTIITGSFNFTRQAESNGCNRPSAGQVSPMTSRESV